MNSTYTKFMEDHPNSMTKSIGICLLPTELMQKIFLALVLPEIIRLKLVSKRISQTISDQNFMRECNSLSSSTTWLLVYKKRWLRDAMLYGFSDQSDRWYRIPIMSFLKPIHCQSDDLYFLMASGNVFLFASNTLQQVIAVNLVTKTVKNIPPSPLGPRGTVSWRRSGMKMVLGPPGSDHFVFMFAELVANRSVLFVYKSESETWERLEAKEGVCHWLGSQINSQRVILHVINSPRESLLIALQPPSQFDCDTGVGNTPVILRPRFEDRYDRSNKLDVYGDGYMMIVESYVAREGQYSNLRMVRRIEIWGLSSNGRQWEYRSSVPAALMDQIKKPYGVMMGCLEERNGVMRAGLMSNSEGRWNTIWLSFDMKGSRWSWVPMPDCQTRGLNMAGISFSSGLTLTRPDVNPSNN